MTSLPEPEQTRRRSPEDAITHLAARRDALVWRARVGMKTSSPGEERWTLPVDLSSSPSTTITSSSVSWT